MLAEQLKTGVPVATPVFDGAREPDIVDMLTAAGFDTALLGEIEEAALAEIDAATMEVRNAPPPGPDTMMTQVWADGGVQWRN